MNQGTLAYKKTLMRLVEVTMSLLFLSEEHFAPNTNLCLLHSPINNCKTRHEDPKTVLPAKKHTNVLVDVTATENIRHRDSFLLDIPPL